MLPVIAIIGRPNVGKSSLFNCLTQSRDALVADMPGVTRDRQYGQGQFEERSYIVVDTGGIFENKQDIFHQQILEQATQAIQEADLILFLVDGRSGCTPADSDIAKLLRKTSKPFLLVINKTDGINPEVAMSDFYQFGFANMMAISTSHQRGLQALMQKAFSDLPQPEAISAEEQGIKIAVIGRPNVGKSTLVNRILGEERVIVCDLAGTTRDSIYIPFTRFEQTYTLIDTAGVRRRGRINEVVEKFSVIKTLQAVEDCQVAVFVMDAREGIVDQDLHLIDFILSSGKGLVLAMNKWDGLDDYQRQRVKTELDRRLPFLKFFRQYFISALHGTNVGHLFEAIQEAHQSAQIELSTHEVSEALQRAFQSHQPPVVQGRPIKLRYAHLGGHTPPTFIVHGNRTEHLPESYKRYLMNYFHEAFEIYGTPIRFQFKTGRNPYQPPG